MKNVWYKFQAGKVSSLSYLEPFVLTVYWLTVYLGIGWWFDSLDKLFECAGFFCVSFGSSESFSMCMSLPNILWYYWFAHRITFWACMKVLFQILEYWHKNKRYGYLTPGSEAFSGSFCSTKQAI